MPTTTTFPLDCNAMPLPNAYDTPTWVTDRFYLETDFSKGHLSEILRGKGSPTVSTLSKLAKALDVEVNELFVFPERGPRDRAIELSCM
jgi:transcriptional regulator with XRE-family HTH domain